MQVPAECFSVWSIWRYLFTRSLLEHAEDITYSLSTACLQLISYTFKETEALPRDTETLLQFLSLPQNTCTHGNSHAWHFTSRASPWAWLETDVSRQQSAVSPFPAGSLNWAYLSSAAWEELSVLSLDSITPPYNHLRHRQPRLQRY